MAPNYESTEKQDDKKAVDWNISRNGSDLLFPGRKGTEPNSLQNHTQKCLDASCRTSISPPTEGVAHRSAAGSNTNLQSTNGCNIPQPRINLNSTAGEAASLSSFGVVSNDTEPEKVWHYKDPSGNVQGPFTLSQLSKWTSHFPQDLRIWLTFESEENSLLLTEVLSKQQKDFIQPMSVTNSNKSTWAGTGQDRSNSSMAEDYSSFPIGYNVVYSSGMSSQSADCSIQTREGPNLPGGTLPSTTSWEPLKDAHTSHGQAQHQANYSCTIPSSAGSHGPPGSHDVGVPQEKISAWNNRQDCGGMWSPTTPHMSNSCQSNAESCPDGCAAMKQLQNANDSKSNSLAGSVENLNSQMDFVSQEVHVPTPQQSERDLATSLGTSSPSEFKTTCQQEGSCWSSTTNPTVHDDLQSSIASAKPESCSPTNPVEDRDSSSASRVPSQSGAPATSNSSKTEETMNQHKTCDIDASNDPVNQPPEPKIDPVIDASNAPVNQPPEPKLGPVLSPDTQDLERKYPTPKLERKEPSMNQSGSASVAPEDSAAKAYGHSSIAFVSETSDPPAGKIVSLQLLKETSCLEERDLKDGGSITQTEQLKDETTAVKRENIVVNPVCDAEAIAVSDVLESLTELNCGTYNMHGATPLENFTPASAEEEQPQCSSPIALSPWGEPSYYQGEAVDSSLWGVQDGPSNDMWSLSSTLALQPSSDLGADGKDASCIIEEVIVAQGNSAAVVMPPTPEEKKMVKGNSSASTGCALLEQVKPKPSVASGLQLSGSSLEGSTKASGLQLSRSSVEGSTKAAGWQLPGSSLEGSTKASGLHPSGSSTEGSTKASGWQRSSSSPERGRKTSGWHSSARESPKVNSTSSASQNRNSSSSHHTSKPTAKHSSEASRRQGNTNTNTAGWEEALGNKSWHSSAGNASRSSQSSHHHNRYSQGSESWRGSSNHSRWSDHRQDHGSGGSSRSSSRGQSQRVVCKFYENGHCRKGASCQYLHR